MKKVVLSFAVAMLALAANAQKKEGSKDMHFSVGARVGLPIGDFSNGSSIGFGGEVGVEKMFSDKLSGIGSVGYMTFSGKEQTRTTTIMGQTFTTKIPGVTTSFIPVTVGARYYAAEQFFVGARLGYAVSGNSGGKGGFLYEPQIGYNHEKFQAAVGYNGISVTGGTLSFIGLNVAYKF